MTYFSAKVGHNVFPLTITYMICQRTLLNKHLPFCVFCSAIRVESIESIEFCEVAAIGQLLAEIANQATYVGEET